MEPQILCLRQSKKMIISYGFSLLEVLIATFILAFGIFGIMELYIHSLKNMHAAYQRTLDISRIIAEREKY